MGLRLTLSGTVAAAVIGLAAAEPPARSAAAAAAPAAFGPAISPTARLPLEQIPGDARDRVRAVLEHPTLRTQGPAEQFACQPGFYYWLLDHPDQAVRLWRALGVACAPIQDRGDGRFAWQDGLGSTIAWATVLRAPGRRVWFAEGQVKPGVLPAATIRAVVCLSYREEQDDAGRTLVRHQVGVHLQTDSRAVALAARLLGASAQRLAEQYAGQIQTFYGALAWYCQQHPREARELLKALEPQR